MQLLEAKNLWKPSLRTLLIVLTVCQFQAVNAAQEPVVSQSAISQLDVGQSYNDLTESSFENIVHYDDPGLVTFQPLISGGHFSKDPDFQKLKGSWEVLSVEHDGELTPAQIGQEPGDVISLVPKESQRIEFG